MEAERDLAQQDLTVPRERGSPSSEGKSRNRAGVKWGDKEGSVEVGFHEQMGYQQPNESRRCSGWQEPLGWHAGGKATTTVPGPSRSGANGLR